MAWIMKGKLGGGVCSFFVFRTSLTFLLHLFFRGRLPGKKPLTYTLIAKDGFTMVVSESGECINDLLIIFFFFFVIENFFIADRVKELIKYKVK